MRLELKRLVYVDSCAATVLVLDILGLALYAQTMHAICGTFLGVQLGFGIQFATTKVQDNLGRTDVG